MKKTFFRVVLKYCVFQTSQSLPSFKTKVGKLQKTVSPFGMAGTEQHYNHQFVLERATEPDFTIDCLVKEKLYASGKASFDKQQQKIDLADSKKKKLGTLHIQVKKIDKKNPVIEFKAEVYSGSLAGEYSNKLRPYLIIKMGDTHIKTKIADSTKDPQWNQTFDMKSSDEQNVFVEAWLEDVKASTFVGICVLNLEQAMNRKNNYDLVDNAQKKVGTLLLRLYENGKEQAGEVVINDKNIIPMKNLKMYILEALLKQNSTTKKDTYIKIDVDGQKTQTTTSIFTDTKNPKWNQTFNIAIKEGYTGKIKVCLCEKDDKGVEHVVGTAFLDPKEIENKQYELALKTNDGQLGKLYMECEGDWIQKKQEPQEDEQEEEPKKLPEVKSGINSYKSAANNEELERRINEMKAKYSTKPLHQYFYSQLNAVLQEGLLKIARQKPADPIRELGLFLINYKRK